MKYSFLYICLFSSFVACCSAKEIEIGAVLQLDKDAIQKIAAVLQKRDNDTNPEKKYVEYLKELVKIMKSYDAEKLGEVFHVITDNVRKMLQKENVTNTHILKDLSKVKYEIRDQMRRKLLDETLKALEDTSEVGVRRQKLIEVASKDFKKEDITSFINYLKLFKHDTKRANTKTRGFKKLMNRMIRATMVILKYLRDDTLKSKQQKITTKKIRKPHHVQKHEPIFEDKFEYDNQDEGLKMKLDHDYFVMDRLWEELTHTTAKSPLRTRRTRPTPAPFSDIDDTGTIIPSQNEEIFVTEFENTPTPRWKHKHIIPSQNEEFFVSEFDNTPTPQLKHKHLKKDVLADIDIEVKKTTNLDFTQNAEIFNTERDVNDKEEPSQLLRQLYPLKKKNVKILRQDKKKTEIQNNPDNAKSLLEMIKGKAKKLTNTDDKKESEMLRQRLPPEMLDTNVNVSKKRKSKKKTDVDGAKISSELIRGDVKRPKESEHAKSSENNTGRLKKLKTIKIKDSLELIREQIKMKNDINKKKASSELPRLEHRGKAKQSSDAEDIKNSAELIRQLFPPEMKIMNVKILKQENGIPQEIHLQHDALIDVRNFGQKSNKTEPE